MVGRNKNDSLKDCHQNVKKDIKKLPQLGVKGKLLHKFFHLALY